METPTHTAPPFALDRLVRPLIVGARVWLNDGQNKLIVRINALNEAEAGDSAYRWERNGGIAHSNMTPGDHDIAMVDWPNGLDQATEGAARCSDEAKKRSNSK